MYTALFVVSLIMFGYMLYVLIYPVKCKKSKFRKIEF